MAREEQTAMLVQADCRDVGRAMRQSIAQMEDDENAQVMSLSVEGTLRKGTCLWRMVFFRKLVVSDMVNKFSSCLGFSTVFTMASYTKSTDIHILYPACLRSVLLFSLLVYLNIRTRFCMYVTLCI
jgi:hypothetical protein